MIGYKWKYRFKRVVNSKILVTIAILITWFGGSAMKTAEAETYSFGAVYQYYLLYNQAKTVTESAEDTDVALSMGSLGSGGVSGSFSYDDIVNSASDENKNNARRFASMMSTYATFGYFDNKVQGFESIVSFAGRILFSIVLLPLSILMDILTLIIPQMIGLIAKFNVITLLAQALGNLSVTSELANALGISTGTIVSITNALLSFAISMILISLVMMLRNGSNKIDQKHSQKLKGRLITLVALPLIVFGSASFLAEVYKLSGSEMLVTGNFSRYLIDNRSWAYNFNFAPRGNSDQPSDIYPSSKSSYVDLEFNPYTLAGAERISAINSKSSLASSDTDNIFANTALVLAYGSSDSFSAVDFINYKGTEESQHFYGRSDGDGESFGSYYKYAHNMADTLLTDVSRGISGSGKDLGGNDSTGPYKSAIDDYVKNDELVVTPEIAWRDRYIYGAKSAGVNIDKYYAEVPSQEQIKTEVGTNGKSALANQSMFLVLSTIFDETGGRYYIDAPARGILQAKASFDSNRSTYYVVSMVGTPFFTLFGLISEPIIQLVVLLAVVTAILSMGIIEMNLRPLSAYTKGLIVGDLEYPQAFLIYALGIGGTVLMLSVFPPLVATAIRALGNVITLPAEFLDKTALSPQASLALEGIPLLFSAFFALLFAFLYVKSASFRHKLIDLFTYIWAWAKTAGERLEAQVNGGMGMRVSREQESMRNRSKFSRNFDRASESYSSPLGAIRNLAEQTINDLNPKKERYIPPMFRDDDDDNHHGDTSTNKTNDLNEVKRRGVLERAEGELATNRLNGEASDEVVLRTAEAEEAVKEFKENPSPKTFKNAQDKLYYLKNQMEADGSDQKRIRRIEDVIDDVNNVGNDRNYSDESKNNQKSKDSENKRSKTNSENNEKTNDQGEQQEVDERINDPEAEKKERYWGDEDSSNEVGSSGNNKQFRKPISEVEDGKRKTTDKRMNEVSKDDQEPTDSRTIKETRSKKINELPKANDLESEAQTRESNGEKKTNTIENVASKRKNETNQNQNRRRVLNESPDEKRTTKTETRSKEDAGEKKTNTIENVASKNKNKTNQNQNQNRRRILNGSSDEKRTTNLSKSGNNNHHDNNSKMRKANQTTEKRTRKINVPKNSQSYNKTNNTRIKQIHSLSNGLGKASNNSEIKLVIQNLENSKTPEEIKSNIPKLTRAMRQLDKKTQGDIDHEKVMKSISNMLQSTEEENKKDER